MSFQNPLKFTNAGREVQLQALTGKPLIFTTVRMGDGELSSAISVMTSLINERVSVTVNTAVANSQYATIEAIFKNTDLTAGFYWRELGIYVADPDDPDNRDSDILYAYQNVGEFAEYINSPGSSVIEKIIRIPVFVGETTNVSVYADSIVQQDATVTQFEESTVEDKDYMTFYDSSALKNKKISFANIREKITEKINQLLTAHKADKNNPHNVTYSQTGAASEEHSHKISDVSTLTNVLNNYSANILNLMEKNSALDDRVTLIENPTADLIEDISDSFGEPLNAFEISDICVYKMGHCVSGTIVFVKNGSPTSNIEGDEAFRIANKYMPVFQNLQFLPYCAYKAESENSESPFFIQMQCVLSDGSITLATNEWGNINYVYTSFSYICS